MSGAHDDLARRAMEMQSQIRQQEAAARLRATWDEEPVMIGDSYAAESRWDYTWRRISPINLFALIFLFGWYATWTLGRIVWFMTSARWTPARKDLVRRVILFSLIGVPLIVYIITGITHSVGGLFP